MSLLPGWCQLSNLCPRRSLLSSCFSLASSPSQQSQMITDPSFWNGTQKVSLFFLLKDILSLCRLVWTETPHHTTLVSWGLVACATVMAGNLFFQPFMKFLLSDKKWPAQKVFITSQSKLAPFYVLCSYQHFWLHHSITYLHGWEIHALISTTGANISFITK